MNHSCRYCRNIHTDIHCTKSSTQDFRVPYCTQRFCMTDFRSRIRRSVRREAWSISGSSIRRGKAICFFAQNLSLSLTAFRSVMRHFSTESNHICSAIASILLIIFSTHSSSCSPMRKTLKPYIFPFCSTEISSSICKSIRYFPGYLDGMACFLSP